MPYYIVQGRFIEEVEEYVQAKSKKEAIEKVEEQNCDWLDDVSIELISKEDYEEHNNKRE